MATLCALMDKIFNHYQQKFVLCFIDDCLVFTPIDYDLHLKQLDQVLQKIDHANLRLKVEKCKFAFSEVPFLGHIVGRAG